ncbi:Transcription factor [Paramarasmius palmivorus]|uniref:Transcription factor n=1 Tax=Paramarasmius palmivorus TaxID=297713 RepID=A0AAW0DFU1_9AGAR
MSDNKRARSPSPPVGLPPAQRRKVRDSESSSLDSPRRISTNDSKQTKTPTSPLKSGREPRLKGTPDAPSTHNPGMSTVFGPSESTKLTDENSMPFSKHSNPGSISVPPRPPLALSMPELPDSISAPHKSSSSIPPHPSGIFTAMEDHLRTLNVYTETRKAELQFVEETLGRKTSELHEIEEAVATKTVELRDITLQVAEQKEMLEQLSREKDSVKEKMKIELNELLEAYERDVGRFMERSKEAIGKRFQEKIERLGREKPITVTMSPAEPVTLEDVAKTPVPEPRLLEIARERSMELTEEASRRKSKSPIICVDELPIPTTTTKTLSPQEKRNDPIPEDSEIIPTSPQETDKESTDVESMVIEENTVSASIVVPKLERDDSTDLGSPLTVTEDEEVGNLLRSELKPQDVEPWFFYFQGETEVEIEEFSEVQRISMDRIKSLIGKARTEKHREWEWAEDKEWLPRYIFRPMKDLSRRDVWAEFEYGLNGNLPVKLLYEHWGEHWLSDTKDFKKARDRKRFHDLVESLKEEHSWTTEDVFGFLDACYPITGKKNWKDRCSTVGKFVTWLATDKTNAVSELREKAENYRMGG